MYKPCIEVLSSDLVALFIVDGAEEILDERHSKKSTRSSTEAQIDARRLHSSSLVLLRRVKESIDSNRALNEG
jgi:hypothetical protein